MCGIVGLALNDLACWPDELLVRRMAHALLHRGPDDSGGFRQPGIALAMRRLAIIDLPHGRQPVINEAGDVVAVFNGEIYNFRSLRDQLQARGHQFASAADSEVIVHLYEEHGLEFVQHLNGMFAIALWDQRRRQLVLVRDRLGVKPLYYSQLSDRIVFGSEIKALLQDPLIPRRVDHQALHQLITFGHFQAPGTCWQEIRELPPATLLTFRQGQLQLHTYWDLEFPSAAEPQPPAKIEETIALLREAVQRRLISDVPLGAFLSGGIDSSLIVAFMHQLGVSPLRTFSIGFADEDFSELPFARQVAQHFHTEHHEFVVRPELREILPDLIAHHDAPFYDTSAIPTYHLCRLAREHVTVALAGDGGDEMFAGYNIFLANQAASYLARVPAWLRSKVLLPLARAIPESSSYINTGRVAREFMTAVGNDTLTRYARWATKVKRETREALYAADELRRQLQTPDAAAWDELFHSPAAGTRDLQRLLYLATKTELPGDMLVKVDRMSMAHSLEVRSPLLDFGLFQYAAGLPDRDKLRGWTSKFHLRQIARRLLPPAVVSRPKRGFAVPLDRWLRNDLQHDLREILLDPGTRKRGLFVPSTVERLIQEHLQGRTARGRELWILMTIELWQRMYVDQLHCRVAEPAPLEFRPAGEHTADSSQLG
jgi:asparagine synthase (glutamine-hydrolysing)